jgi:GTPase SAR1 family protein
MSKKVIIVGSGDCGLTAMALSELKGKFPEAEVVTIEQAKERGLSESIEYKARPQLSPIEMMTAPYNNGHSLSSRNIRRKDKRNKNKKRK